jgi:hypothetical protein
MLQELNDLNNNPIEVRTHQRATDNRHTLSTLYQGYHI